MFSPGFRSHSEAIKTIVLGAALVALLTSYVRRIDSGNGDIEV